MCRLDLQQNKSPFQTTVIPRFRCQAVSEAEGNFLFQRKTILTDEDTL